MITAPKIKIVACKSGDAAADTKKGGGKAAAAAQNDY
jgi:transcription initiation factor TFIIA small subunit